MLILATFSMAGALRLQGAPSILFVEQSDLQTASMTSNGDDGLTRLAAIFQRQGVVTGITALDQPIPETAQVLVLIRAVKPLSGEQLSRLWAFLERGGSLLLALDPVGQGGNPDGQSGGIDILFGADYGIRLLDNLITEPWSTSETAGDVRRSTIYAYPTGIVHPVIQPLIDYEVPVMMWGTRNIRAELLAPYSQAYGLLYVDGFSGANGSRVTTPLVVGALAESISNRSRIAILGDSELFLNQYGLATIPTTMTPVHAGNYVLAQRVVDWLLRRPFEEWQPLPDMFTWVAVDGNPGDWGNLGSVTTDPEGDTSLPGQNIRQVRSFRNQEYAYFQIETLSPPDEHTRVLLEVDSDVNGEIDRSLTFDAAQSIVGQGEQQLSILDASLGIDEVIELRIPLRVTGIGPTAYRLCLTTARDMAFPVDPDCVENIPVPVMDQPDPSELQIPDTPLATVYAQEVINVRANPGTAFDIISTIRSGDVVAAVGRNEASDWIKVQAPRYEGWISILALQLNTPVGLLPVMP